MAVIPTFSRAAVLAVALGGPCLLANVPLASAAPVAKQQTQVPGYYRMMLGELEVTALYDGYVDLPATVLKGASAEDIQSLLAHKFVESSKGMQTAINAFLINTGTRLLLVDTGAAACFGPTGGTIGRNLEAAGYKAEQVDGVLLTHLHPDHACGLRTADGGMAFPNADVYVPKGETDYWLSSEIAAQAPEAARGMFDMARSSVQPYQQAKRLKIYQGSVLDIPGVSVVASPGHTPGHSGYQFDSANAHLLVWGDIVHSHAVQFARPEVSIEFDVDSDRAIESRQKLFADTALQRTWVAGAHLPFPGIGHVDTQDDGYAWVPVEYSPLRSDR